MWTSIVAIVWALSAAIPGVPTGSVVASPASSAVFVDCSAPTNGVGSQVSPYNSIPAVNAARIGPGASVLFRRATTCNGQLNVAASGTAAAPITYGAWGTGAAPSIQANGNVAAVWMHDVSYVSYVTVQDLTLSASGNNTTARRGVWLEATNSGDHPGIVLQNLTIHDVRGVLPSAMAAASGGKTPVAAGSADGKYGGASGGLVAEALGSTRPTSFTGLVIRNNVISSVDREGIYLWSNWCRRPDLATFWDSLCTASWHPATNPVIVGNTLSDIGGDGIAPMTVSGGEVAHNTLSGFNERAGTTDAGMWAANTDNLVFEYNVTSGGNTTKDGMAYDVDHSTNGIIFQYNVSYDNDGGFMLICPYGEGVPGNAKNFTIRYNLSVDDHARDFQVCSGGAQGGQIYNNTFYLPDDLKSGQTLQLFLDPAAKAGSVTVAMTNNVFLRHSTGGTLLWSVHDPAFSASHTVVDNVPGPPNATDTITAAPELKAPSDGDHNPDDYRPDPDSPFRFSGATVPANGGVDFFGTKITDPPIIGFAQN